MFPSHVFHSTFSSTSSSVGSRYKTFHSMQDFRKDIAMNNSRFGRRLEMEPQYHHTSYFYPPVGHHPFTAMYPRPQVVPMFMPCIQQPDTPRKSFKIEDILRRPHNTCMTNRPYLSSEVAGSGDYRFGLASYWESGMWRAVLSERFTGINSAMKYTLSRPNKSSTFEN